MTMTTSLRIYRTEAAVEMLPSAATPGRNMAAAKIGTQDSCISFNLPLIFGRTAKSQREHNIRANTCVVEGSLEERQIAPNTAAFRETEPDTIAAAEP
jgi:hypothetical protein